MRYILPVLIVALLAACTERNELPAPNGVTVNIVPGHGDTVLVLHEKYAAQPGIFIKPSAFRFYLSNISVQLKDGSWQQLKDAWLFDLSTMQTNFELSVPRDAIRLRYGIGVPPGINQGDPTVYPQDHPYSVQGSNGMHWNWNTGYKFVVFEGKMDSIPDGQFSGSFSFHTGMDTLFRTVEVALPPDFRTIEVRIDASQLFRTIDLATENQTHGGTSLDLARRFTDNFIYAVDLSFK